MEQIWLALQATAFPCLCTALGSACVFVMGRGQNEQGRRVMDGFAGGVMLAAGMFSLLVPAIEGSVSWVPPVVGLLAGALLLVAAEMEADALMTGENSRSHAGRVAVGIALHNLPEGMVVGLAAALCVGGTPEQRAGAAALSVGIGLQNLPEGAAVSLPLYQAGQSRGKAFRAGVLSGLVEPAGGIVAALLTAHLTAVMPWLLAGAAGVMLCLTAQELLPAAAPRKDGLLSFLLGFALMMVMDIAL